MNARELLSKYCYSVVISKRGRLVVVAAGDQEAIQKGMVFGRVLSIRMMHPTRLHRDRRSETDEILYQSLIAPEPEIK